jgi:desulfoferrodoxin (superoxide reductase-like protein)
VCFLEHCMVEINAKNIDGRKKHVKIIEHEKLHFNGEIGKIEQLDVNAGERPLDMEKK